MSKTNAKPLPKNLYIAHDWISAAGEWASALENPKQYAIDAFANYEQHREEGDGLLTVQDLLDVIEYHRQYETDAGRAELA